MKQNIVALISGLIFGIGLFHSEMVDPGVVIGFLDVTGRWNPALMGVMGGALLVTGLSFRFIRPQGKTFCQTAFNLPAKKNVDTPLVFGSMLFGIGWGLAGICPGPAATSIAFLDPKLLSFTASMLAGMAAFQLFMGKQ